ncbi:hypothetical protein AV521_36520 [Streptomyces sp. IMTB 2501]|nr:hypothetical protein AV521_36520 [Streptomyces sp. IMTB 2501]
MRGAYHEELTSAGGGLVEMARLVGSAIGRAASALLRPAGPPATGRHGPAHPLRMSADLNRSGHLAAHVAKLARLRHPGRAVPGDLHRTILEMGQLAQRLMTHAAEVLVAQDVEAALKPKQDGDRVAGLHRMIFPHLMDDRWEHGVETTVDGTLVGI